MRMLTSGPRLPRCHGANVGLAVCLMLFAGCLSTLPLRYSPSSTLSRGGAVGVGEFHYLPALNDRVKTNQIQNRALDNLFFDQEIGAFYKDAVFQELRGVGIATESGTRTLTGEIREFLIDDLGADVDWTLRVFYRVNGREKTLYESEKLTRRRSPKRGDPSTALNDTVQANIEASLEDGAFLKAIEER